MKVFKNNSFIKRDYEITNIVFCEAESAPDQNWTECEEIEIYLMSCKHLFTNSGIRYFGYL